MMADVGEPEALTIEQASTRFDIPTSTLRKYLREGKIRKGWQVKAGRKRLVIDGNELRRLLDDLTEGKVRWES